MLQQAVDHRPRFLLSEARKIISDLFQPDPRIYWTDFLLSWAVAVVCFRLVREPFIFWPLRLAMFVASAMLFYRCAIFTHELVHLRQGTFRAFRVVWNLLAGIPLLVPSFTYYTHVDHHRRKHYGTKHDGEYLPLGTSPPSGILLYLGQILVIPILAVVRFGILTPLTWLSPKLRDFVHQHASSMVADPLYIRPLPSKRVLRIIRWQELGCFLFITGATVLFLVGWFPLFVLGQAYCTGVLAVAVNAIRTLGAHRYVGDGSQMTFEEQLLDSVNYSSRNWLATVWAPLGLKYHALHHLFPTLPYHSTGEAHRRLMRELPADSPYRETEEDSLLAVLAALWRAARAASRNADTDPVRRAA